jgi:chromosome segregation ATPase
MDKKERQQIMYRIGDLIEKQCRACKFNGKNRAAKECVPCPTGKELKRLGNLLEPKKKEPKEEKQMKKIREISKEEIVALKEQGKSDPEVMEILGISHVKLNELKQKYDLIGKYPRVYKPRKENPEKQLRELNDELIAKLERVTQQRESAEEHYRDLEDQYDHLKATQDKTLEENQQLKVRVAQLEGLVNELADEKDNMTAACEDLEDEVARYKKQIAEYQQPKDTREEQENILLRRLLKVVL